MQSARKAWRFYISTRYNYIPDVHLLHNKLLILLSYSRPIIEYTSVHWVWNYKTRHVNELAVKYRLWFIRPTHVVGHAMASLH